MKKISTPFTELGLGSTLSDAASERLSRLALISTYPSHSILFREGQSHRTLYWVWYGRISLEMGTAGHRSKPLLTVGKGELLAWSALVGDRRMTATATTLVETGLVGFDADELRQLCEADHEIGYRLMQHVAEGLSTRLLATRLQLLDLFSSPDEIAR